jgi:hypothetical protein
MRCENNKKGKRERERKAAHRFMERVREHRQNAIICDSGDFYLYP